MDNAHKLPFADQGSVAGVLTITTSRDGVAREVGRFPNKVVSASGFGRNLIARQLIGDTTYPLEIDSAALGSSATAADDTQTGLITPVVSGIAISAASAVGGIVTVDVFVADANLANGTYREFGLFCNGRLFARVVVSPDYTKVSGEDTLFSYTLTLSG